MRSAHRGVEKQAHEVIEPAERVVLGFFGAARAVTLRTRKGGFS